MATRPYILRFRSMLERERLLSFARAPVLRASSADMGTSVASRYWDARPDEGAISLPSVLPCGVVSMGSGVDAGLSAAASSAALGAAEVASFWPKVSVAARPGISGLSLKRSGSAIGLSLLGCLVTGFPALLLEVADPEVEAEPDDDGVDEGGGVGG